MIELVGVNIAYDELEITVPADEPFSIHFINDDPPGVPHDVDIETDGGEVLQDTDTIDGGGEGPRARGATGADDDGGSR